MPTTGPICMVWGDVGVRGFSPEKFFEKWHKVTPFFNYQGRFVYVKSTDLLDGEGMERRFGVF